MWQRVAPLLSVLKGKAETRGRKAAETPGKKRGGRKDKSYELAYRDCAVINSSLSDKTDVSEAKVLDCNTTPQRCFTGQMVGHDGFLLSRQQLNDLLRKSKDIREVTFPHLNGKEFLTGSGLPTRFVVDFGQRDQLEAAAYAPAFEWVQEKVLPDRLRKSRQGVDKEGKVRPHHKQFLSRWWQLSFPRPELIAQIEQLRRFIVCSRVTKRPVFVFVSPRIRPGDALSCFAFHDDYSFGVLQSTSHWQWFLAKCSKLKSDFRYSPDSVFDTFPWPQAPSAAQIDALAGAGREVRRVRTEALAKVRGGLRVVYRTLELPGRNPLKDAHTALDAAVLAAYGFSAKKDLLGQLLDLNREVASRIDEGKPVLAPGIPPSYADSRA